MKKIYIVFIFLFLAVFPIDSYAKEGIDNYFIDATVLDNGDLHVKELIVLNGEFNGFRRIINYKNLGLRSFDGSISSFEGSDIYNGSDIVINKIMDIPVTSNMSFNSLFNNGTTFNSVNYASVGDDNVYIKSSKINGIELTIYNPSNGKRRGFYIEYVIKNLAIKHNDVAEIGWNIFSDEMSEYIDYLELRINIPNNQEELRVWAHGPLNGNINPISKKNIKLTITELNANTAIDTRFVFDKNAIGSVQKITDVNALDKILTIETKLADEANKIREEARATIARQKFIGRIFNFTFVTWTCGLLFFIRYAYIKFDKEHKSGFRGKYYRDFPAEYNPEIVEYLFSKKISSKGLSSSILNLIYKKEISFEGNKNNYILINNKKNSDLKESEKTLMNWLFNDSDQVDLNQFKKDAKKGYEEFFKKYNKWITEATKEANDEKLYEKNSVSGYLYLYSFVGILLTIISTNYYANAFLAILVTISAIVSIIYYATITKRSIKGNDDYSKWKALKNFMNDFGRMDTKDLPEIVLWEKYLVYAVVLGCADKLSKTMKIKITELDTNASMTNTMFDIYYMNAMLNFNRDINRSINSAVLTATSARSAANSTNSSGFGGGGGFSGGGGSFGGGGGGGRF